jgi:hypothetical protein
MANEAGVSYVEGFEKDEEAAQEKERQFILAKATQMLEKTPKGKQDAGYDMAMESLGILDKPEADYDTMKEETPEMDASLMETEEEPQQMQRGLMARG